MQLYLLDSLYLYFELQLYIAYIPTDNTLVLALVGPLEQYSWISHHQSF